MNNIKKYSFSELYEMSSGISTTKAQAGHGHPFVSFGTVFNNYFLPEQLPDLMDTSEKEQDIYSIKEGDILITRTSETIDELAMSCVATKDYPEATYSGFTKRLRPKTTGIAYHKYLAFYLRGYLFRKAVTNNAFMTLRASFNEDIFSFLNLYLPEYQEQVKIGDMLYNMERKISLNKKISSELEAMAKTLYDYWFVQFDFPDENGKPYRTSGGEMVWNEQLKRKIPKGWGVVRICDIADLYQPKTISGSDMVENGLYNVYGANGIIGKYNSYNHENRTIAITCRGASCGNFLMTLPKAWITGNAMVVSPHAETSQEYLYYTLSKDRISPFITGSAQPQITRENLSNLLVVIANEKNMAEFSAFANVVRSIIESKAKENHELTKLRDWLLPMLMNGQATVE